MTFGRKYGPKCPSKLYDKQGSNGNEKTEQDPARRLKDIEHIARDGQKNDTVIKNAKRILETRVELAMQCKAQRYSVKQALNNSMSTSWWRLCEEAQLGETSCTNEEKYNTIYAHEIDVHKSHRGRIDESGKQRHEEHIADCGHKINDHSGSNSGSGQGWGAN